MKRIIVATLLSGILIVGSSCASRLRADRMMEVGCEEQLDRLIPGMSSPDLAEREKSQRELEQWCFLVSSEQTDTDRAAQCRAMIARLGPETPRLARVWMLRQLQNIGREESVDALAALLDDKDERIREPARRALQSNPAPAAMEALGAALERTTEPAWQIALINALAARHDAAAWKWLLPLSEVADTEVADAAIAALGDVADAGVYAQSHMFWQPDDPARRERATAALLRIGERLVANGDTKLAEKLFRDIYESPLPSHLRAAGLRGLAAADQRTGIDILGEIIRGEHDEDLRLASISILADIDDVRATRALKGSLPLAPPEIQIPILAALGSRGDPEGRTGALSLLGSEDANVRLAAITALQQLGNKHDIWEFVRMAADATDAEQQAARRGLARLRGDDIDAAILEAVKPESYPRMQAELIRALAARYCYSAIPELLELHEGWGSVQRKAVYEALGRIADTSYLSRILDLLGRETDEEVREAGEDAVVAICHKIDEPEQQSAPVLAQLPEARGPVRASLIRVLGRLQTADALAAVRAAVDDDDEEVADAAVRALAKWEDARVLDDLLTLARSADSQIHRVLALRGYVRLLRLPSERPPEDTLTLLTEALSLAEADAERKLVFGALGDVIHIDALNMVRAHLTDEAVRDEAAVAAASIAKGLAGTLNDEALAALQEVLAAPVSEAAKRPAQEALDLIAKYHGYIAAWNYSGPYANEGQKFDEAFEAVFAPESPSAGEAVWNPLHASQPDNPWLFDLTKLGNCSNCCVYVMTEIESDIAQPARLEIGSDDAVKAWLNGELVHSNLAARALTPGEDTAEIALRPGHNTLLLKIVQSNGGWGFACAVRAPDGTPIAGIRCHAP